MRFREGERVYGQEIGLSVEQLTQLVVRMLSKEEPPAQISRRAGIAEATQHRSRDAFVHAGKRAKGTWCGDAGGQAAWLNAQLAERGQVIGELTIERKTCSRFAAQQAREQLILGVRQTTPAMDNVM